MRTAYVIALAAFVFCFASVESSSATSANPKILKSKGHFDYFVDMYPEGGKPDGKYDPGVDIDMGSGTWYTVDAGDTAPNVKQMFYNDGWGEWCDTDPFGNGWDWVYGP